MSSNTRHLVSRTATHTPQVQLDIRQGHAQTVGKVLAWFDEEGGVAGTPVCDCGCGTGSLAIPLALRVRPGRVMGFHAKEGSM